ncbi:MAG: SLC13 family permease [Tissierellales bacterium]|nr:SLC13 family permease [Tissierellales bacterium]MBN2827353.1 SLC13 family permease [Tissierellales bacterium]
MTVEIGLTYFILLIAVFLFVTEKLRSDLVAILIMVLLAWSSLITAQEAFSGLASNAVVSVIAVMMLGYGIDKSGIMKALSIKIIRWAGNSEKKILVYISASVGLISSFMQNIGAAALFLPAVRRICRRTGIHPAKFLMPMGFAAILGGTITMVASGPLIILNDLVTRGGYERFNFFSVTPIGLALLFSGIAYFYFFGAKVLPNPQKAKEDSAQNYLRALYHLPDNVYELRVQSDSVAIDKTIEEIDLWKRFNVHILALYEQGSTVYAPWRKTRIQKNQVLAVLGRDEDVKIFAKDCGLLVKQEMDIFASIKNEEYAGFAEIIIPPKSALKGKSLSQIAFRKNFSVEPVIFVGRDGQEIDFFETPMESGQEMIVFGRWADIKKMKEIRDFVVVTPFREGIEDQQKNTTKQALFSLAVSLVSVMLGIKLSVGFMTGAVLMILLGVIPKDEIYSAVDWKTVFLLAGLIPLGIAFEKTGAANLTADMIIWVISSWGTLPILFAIGFLATLFSLFMSNVAATVLLVPLVLIMGNQFNINPRALALLVAICTSNSFVLPTHQVNAFLMTPGGYQNSDYIKAGSFMTLLFLLVSVLMIYFFYL